MGGTIAPGLYYETARTRYNGLSSPFTDAGSPKTYNQTTTIDSSLTMVMSSIDETTGERIVYSVRIVRLSPTELEFDFTCPFVAHLPYYSYDAAAGSVTFYDDDAIGPYSWTLTKQ